MHKNILNQNKLNNNNLIKSFKTRTKERCNRSSFFNFGKIDSQDPGLSVSRDSDINSTN